MANFRRFRPDDVNKFSKCNLDPFTETYELGFYLQYYAKWPALFQVAEDQDGNIIGYREPSFLFFGGPSCAVPHGPYKTITADKSHSHGQA